MSIPWRMHVWTSDGTSRGTLTPDDQVLSLDAFSVDPLGGSIDADFTAVPSRTGIRARDLIRLDIREADGTWRRVFIGSVVVAGNPNATTRQPYKAIGIRQRYYERVLRSRYLPADDAGVMAWWVNLGVTVDGVDNASQTHVGVELGRRYPGLEYAGEALDALAASAGRFIVPPGETFTVGGVTYGAGETVPAARWTVTPDGTGDFGRFRFERPSGQPLEITEGEDGTRIRWEGVAAEEVVDDVTLVYAAGYSEGAVVWRDRERVNNVPARPLAYQYTHGGGAYGAGKRVTLRNPVDYMTDAAGSPSADSFGWVAGFGPAVDGDDTTYAEASESNGYGYTIVPVPLPAGATPGMIVHLHAKASSTDLWNDNAGVNISVFVGYDADAYAGVEFTIPPSDGDEHDVYLAAPAPATIADADVDSPPGIEIFAAAGARIYTLEAFVVDPAAADRLGQIHTRLPEEHASRVELRGQLGPVRHEAHITRRDGSVVELPVDRVEYSFTRETGLVTTYRLGQPFDAEELHERALYLALARQAAKEDG